MSDKVLLILVDGMRPDGLTGCGDPRLGAYYQSGSYSLAARTVWPSITLPCHVSLFHSCDPAVHGTMDNDYVHGHAMPEGLFELLTRSGKKSAMFYIWEQLRDVYQPGNITYSWFKAWEHEPYTDLDAQATEACMAYIREAQPDFAFLYLGETDEYGHDYGWMSPEYLDCIRRAGDCICRVTEALPPEYSVIVTADHGGHAFAHGEDIPEDMTIPICFHGPRFAGGRQLTDLSILDITPTIADLLGLPADPEWEGHSVCD